MRVKTKLSVQIMGPMVVCDESGRDVTPRNRKTKAVIAALCVAKDGRRSRKWLQSLLWSDRPQPQSAASFRASLSEIRKSFGDAGDVLISDGDYIRLDLERVELDIHSIPHTIGSDLAAIDTEFLEGLTIRDKAFESWVREQRLYWGAKWRKTLTPPDTTAAKASAAPLVEPPASAEDWSLSVAVMPLRCKSDDPAIEYWAEGVSEDIINGLQRTRWLPVISRSSSFVNSGLSDLVSERDFARQLGAMYMVTGTLTPGPVRPVIRVHLHEVSSNKIIWSERFLLIGDEFGGILDEILMQIVSGVERSIALSFQQRVVTQPAESGSFTDHIWRGRWHLAQLTSSDAALAREHFDTALAMRPDAPEALIQLGFWHLWKAWALREDEPLKIGGAFAQRGAAVDPDDGRCFALMGISHAWARNFATAINFLEQSVELTPSLAIAHQQLGSTLNLADRPEEAIRPLRLALRYSPRDRLDFTYQTELAVALVRTGRVDEAWIHATRSIQQKPRYWYGHLVRILAARKSGDPEIIASSLRQFEDLDISISEDHFKWLPFKSDMWLRELRGVLN